MREISGLAKFGYFCVGLFGGLFGVLAAWFMGKDGWGWSEGGKLDVYKRQVEELAKKYASDAPQAATPAATPAAVPVAPVPVSAAAPAAASVADEFDQGAATSPAMPARGDTSPDAHE